jgi:hypothetical protein
MLVVLITGCGSTSANPADPNANSFAIQPAAMSAAVGGTVALQATNATQDVTAQTAWSVSDNTVADVQSNFVHGKKPGKVKVTGTYQGNSTASATLTITPSAPVVTWPQPAGVPAGTVLSATQLDATANVPGTFTYNPAAGTALQAGTQTLSTTFTPTDTNTYSTATLSTTINVTAVGAQVPTLTAVQISGSTGSVQSGQTAQLVATAVYSDKSTAIVTGAATWNSSNTSIASVSAGTVKGVTSGTTQITASYNGVTSSPTAITVSATKPATATLTSIQVSGGSTVATSSSMQLKATGTYSDQTTQDITSSASWTSSQNSMATVQAGSVTGVAAGTVNITASLSGVTSSPAVITVSAKPATLTAIQISGGSTLSTSSSAQLKATGTYSDKTTQDITSTVSWASSQPSVATIQGGLAVGVSAGTTSITATLSGVTGTTSIQVASGHVIQIDPSMSESVIQNSINGGHAGDTVSFAAGTYNLPSNGSNPNGAALNLVAGLTYTGPSGSPAHLVGTGSYPLMYFAGTTVTIEYFTFDNGSIFLEDRVTSATIDYNTFENIDCGTNAAQTVAIFVAGGLNNSDISYNTFQNIGQTCNAEYQDVQGAGGIQMYGFHNLTITHNNFATIYEGIAIVISNSVEFDGAGGHINYNTFTGVHRIAIEMLGTSTNPSGLEVAYTNYSNALLPWAYTFGLSLTAGQNMIVHDNVMNGNNNQPGYVPYAVEIGGVNSSAYNNVLEGYWGWGFAIGTNSSINISNNHICGPSMAAAAPASGSNPVAGNAGGFISWEANAATGTFTGNTTSSALTCP